jgi:hypothetical protein
MKFLIKITILCLLTSFALNEIFKTVAGYDLEILYINNKIIYKLLWDSSKQTLLKMFDTVDDNYPPLTTGTEDIYFAMTKKERNT